ncbi:MAG: S1 RNA-binding domain-containing protein [Deltaproteobacteria bacterium]|nr:MAG: S1 RNA-binding domain-containing protein [Deltaproteobacteria bacterium]
MPGSDDEDFAALFAASEGRTRERRVAAGDVIRGRVVAVGSTAAFVAVGGKAEATIDLGEFRDPTTGEVQLHEGDEIEATVVDDGARSGSIVLKRVAGRGGHVPGELEQAFAHGIAIEGLVTGENKGGYDVQIAQYVGQRFSFRITKLEGGGRNVVVSRRQLLEDEAAEQARAVWADLRVGAVVAGTVTSLRDFGAFVDLGGVDGLIHLSELGHGRASHPSEVLQVGQRVEAQVVKLEPDAKGGRGRVGLSLRALAPDPWATVAERFPVGTSVRGTVRRLEQFGAFVELAPGLDGLVHVSRLAVDRRVSHPRQIVSIGETVDVTVVELDVGKRRIGLSMVERAKRDKDAAEAEERRDTEQVLTRSSEKASLGTLGDLLGKKPKR